MCSLHVQLFSAPIQIKLHNEVGDIQPLEKTSAAANALDTTWQ